MSTLSLFVLGAPRIEVDGVVASTDRRKAVALLVYLAMSPRAHSREALAALFWPDYAAESAFAYLRRTLWELNRLLGPEWIEARRDQIALRTGVPLWCDAAQLEQAMDADAETATLQRLVDAVKLYRGDFLEGFTLRDCPDFDQWQTLQTEHLRRRYRDALARVAERLHALGRTEESLRYAQQRAALDPLDSAAAMALMRLYAAAGQRSAALRHYEQYAAGLRAEMGAEPEAAVTALHTQIRHGVAQTAPSAPAPQPAAPPAAPRYQLPTPPTPFVGRRRALAELAALLRAPSVRLLTLIGPGGSGKTRLGLEAARRLAADPTAAPDQGACFVSLAPLLDSTALASAIAKALDFNFYVQDEKTPRQQLIDFLRPKRLLLLLDNFEHLVDDEGVGLVVDLLREAPEVKLVVTSRTRLNVQGEQLYPVPGMSAPELHPSATPDIPALLERYSALQLFLQVAQRVQPDFALTQVNLADVAHICQRVQGMPLAIELAAAWLEVLTPAEIDAEIARCLDFLGSELRDLPERQRSLRAVFDSSWRLLSTHEQDAYLRLSIFRGGFTRDAAQHVGAVGLPELMGLVNKSWLQRGADGRFQVHELLRQYAEERLHTNPTQASAVRRRHAEYYAGQARRWEEALRGPQQRRALEMITVEYENLRAAWRTLVDAHEFTDIVDALLPCLFTYSRLRGQSAEFSKLAHHAYLTYTQGPAYDADSPTAAMLLTALAWYGIVQWIHPVPLGEIRQAWSIVEKMPDPLVLGIWYEALLSMLTMDWGVSQSIAYLEASLPRVRAAPTWRLAHYLASLGELLNSAGEFERAHAVLVEALALMRQLEDRAGQAWTLYALGIANRNLEQFATSIEQLQTARGLLLELGDLNTAAFVTWLLAETALMMGAFEEAFGYFEEESAMYSQVGDRLSVTFALNYESFQALRYGDIEHAKRSRQRYMRICEELGERIRIAWGYWEWGDLLRIEGDHRSALAWYERARPLFAQTNLALGEAFYWRGLGEVAYAEDDFAQAVAHLEKALTIVTPLNHPWALAYLQGRLGCALARLGRLETAQLHLTEALRLTFQYSLRDLVMLALLGCAELLAARQQHADALAVAGYVRTHMLSWHEFKRQAARLEAELQSTLPALSPDHLVELAALSPIALLERHCAGLVDVQAMVRLNRPLQSARRYTITPTSVSYQGQTIS